MGTANGNDIVLSEIGSGMLMSLGKSWGEDLQAFGAGFGPCIGGPRGGLLSGLFGSRGLWGALWWTLRGGLGECI